MFQFHCLHQIYIYLHNNTVLFLGLSKLKYPLYSLPATLVVTWKFIFTSSVALSWRHWHQQAKPNQSWGWWRNRQFCFWNVWAIKDIFKSTKQLQLIAKFINLYAHPFLTFYMAYFMRWKDDGNSLGDHDLHLTSTARGEFVKFSKVHKLHLSKSTFLHWNLIDIKEVFMLQYVL